MFKPAVWPAGAFQGQPSYRAAGQQQQQAAWPAASKQQEEVMDLRVERKKSEPLLGRRWPKLLGSLLAEPGAGDRAGRPEGGAAQRRPAPIPLTAPSCSERRRGAPRRSRRERTMFSEWQLAELEWRFSRNKYLITSDRIRVAKLLELNQLQVKTWFQVSGRWSGRASGDGRAIVRPEGASGERREFAGRRQIVAGQVERELARDGSR